MVAAGNKCRAEPKLHRHFDSSHEVTCYFHIGKHSKLETTTMTVFHHGDIYAVY